VGARGPIPARSDQRVRRNKPEVAIDKVQVIGKVRAPDLGFDDPHPIILDFYLSLPESAQSRYYEPSDYQQARLIFFFLDKQLKSPRPSAQMVAACFAQLSNLLVSEGDRRRVRMEVERAQSGGEVLDVAEIFRARLSQG
jgi:hypothetical protein